MTNTLRTLSQISAGSKTVLETTKQEILLNQQALNTELIRAVKEENTKKVKYLLKKGAKVNEKDDIGWTLLMWASIHGHTEIATLLLKKGAKVNEKANDGSTPLMWASISGHTEVITLLLKKGAKVNEQNNDGWTPSMLASIHGHTEVVTLLKSYEAKK